jgi:hypothetical protein
MQFCNGITVEKTRNGLTLLTPYYFAKKQNSQEQERVLMEAFYLPTDKVDNLLENKDDIKSRINEWKPIDV